jgi:hypothetical protein
MQWALHARLQENTAFHVLFSQISHIVNTFKVKTYFTEFRQNWTVNLESKARNPFTTLSTVWLSLRQFSWNLKP